MHRHTHSHKLLLCFKHKRTHVITYKTHTVWCFLPKVLFSFYLLFSFSHRVYVCICCCCCCCFCCHKNIKLWNDSGILYREWGDTNKKMKKRPFYYDIESRSHISGIVIYKGCFSVFIFSLCLSFKGRKKKRHTIVLNSWKISPKADSLKSQRWHFIEKRKKMWCDTNKCIDNS